MKILTPVVCMLENENNIVLHGKPLLYARYVKRTFLTNKFVVIDENGIFKIVEYIKKLTEMEYLKKINDSDHIKHLRKIQ